MTERVKIFLIILLGSGLRLFQLGRSSFWFDEAGVAAVVYSRSLTDFANLVRSHVMAVPLDYAVTWIVGQQCNTETCLRIPSAIWGILALLAGYYLCLALFNSRVASRAMLLMALSPFLIQYAQELRFYSSLIFFYLLCSYLLFQALHLNQTKIWLLAALFLCIGIFFHIFTAFALMNGWGWALLKKTDNQTNRVQTLRKMILVSLVALSAILVAYFTFLGYTPTSLSHQLFDFEHSFLRLFGIALGWLPFYGRNFSASWLWGILCFVLETTGIIILIYQRPKSPAAGLLYSMIVQIGGIICANIAKHYAVTPRQFIAMLPFGLMLVAFGSTIAQDWITKMFSSRPQPQKPSTGRSFALNWIFITIFILTSLPALSEYYNIPKSNDMEIAEYLAENWQDGDLIFFISVLTSEPVKYYLSDRMGREEIVPYLRLVNEENLSTILYWENKVYLVSPLVLNEKSVLQLTSAGFTQIPATSRWRNQTIWTRKDK